MLDKNLFAGKKIALLWFWLEGKSTLNFLLHNGFVFEKLTVLDVKDQPELEEQGIALRTGEQYLSHLEDFDIIFKSAGVPYSAELKPYQDKVLTQMQFFFDHYKGKVIAITASKWKSTMTSLIYELLKDAGFRVKLVWNIGKPVLDEIDFEEERDYVVCELSSYMLEKLKKQNFISVLWAIFPEHLDWHGGFEHYTQAKLNILKWSELNFVLARTVQEFQLSELYDNLHTYGQGGESTWADGVFTYQGEKLFSTEDRLLLGEHNLQNISLGIAVAKYLWINNDSIHQTIAHFHGLPHRLQLVGTFKGITFYDDAISTTPDSTLEALKTFGNKVWTLFLWGTDRGYDFKILVEKIKELWIQNLVFFPPSGEKIRDLLSDFDWNTLSTRDMDEAVRFAYQHTAPWKVCLLSTASPSYSNWKNFEEKGELFQQAIKKYWE